MRYFVKTILMIGVAACGSDDPAAPADDGDTGEVPPGVLIPLTELGERTYLGFAGGLYPGGSNAVPAAHASLGTQFVRNIRLLDGGGAPSASGKYVLLSIGMSNTTQEFCGGNVMSCAGISFVGQALADASVDRTRLVIVDGAQGSRPIEDWQTPNAETFDRVRDMRLAPLGVTEAQVQAVWIKQANPRPTVSLPAPNADAYAIVAGLANIVRAVKARYPNVQVAFLSSRIYAGYAAPGTLNPEPFAYESGFAVKWLIEAQIEQGLTGPSSALAGDLRPGAAAPWLAWGPYLWADGDTPRADGLVWLPGDYQSDATHPGLPARQKVGTLLLDFMKTSPHASCWFLAGRTC